MNKWEKACRIWLNGCLCVPKYKPEECPECTEAFRIHLLDLLRNEGDCPPVSVYDEHFYYFKDDDD